MAGPPCALEGWGAFSWGYQQLHYGQCHCGLSQEYSHDFWFSPSPRATAKRNWDTAMLGMEEREGEVGEGCRETHPEAGTGQLAEFIPSEHGWHGLAPHPSCGALEFQQE